MESLTRFPTGIVIQPTTLCNLNCSYCYLPHRTLNKRMSPLLAAKIAAEIDENATAPLLLMWHGGEPLATGYDHFSRLLQPFVPLVESGRLLHNVQTNATLLDDRWCELLTQHRFTVGVSIDGPMWATAERVDWQSRAAYPRIIRGIKLLSERGFPFSIIAVVTAETLAHATELYEFFVDLGPASLGINIEEMENANTQQRIRDDEAVHRFWADLFTAWKADPRLHIREFQRALSYMEDVCSGSHVGVDGDPPLPTIGYNGDVVLLAPELAGAHAPQYNDFIVGNVAETPLSEVMQRGLSARYVRDYNRGVARCRETCPYFGFCPGGSASNKFFETGSTDATETANCRRVRKIVLDTMIAAL